VGLSSINVGNGFWWWLYMWWE